MLLRSLRLTGLLGRTRKHVDFAVGYLLLLFNLRICPLVFTPCVFLSIFLSFAFSLSSLFRTHTHRSTQARPSVNRAAQNAWHVQEKEARKREHRTTKCCPKIDMCPWTALRRCIYNVGLCVRLCVRVESPLNDYGASNLALFPSLPLPSEQLTLATAYPACRGALPKSHPRITLDFLRAILLCLNLFQKQSNIFVYRLLPFCRLLYFSCQRQPSRAALLLNTFQSERQSKSQTHTESVLQSIDDTRYSG